ncbi:MAG TPA: 50S ribosomal protein L21 [Nitrospinae bacterium]|nr:50S ribosomal protein L21 [Nitrospinota bacterium]HBA26485.1 50S ribosomal protein L21 [Nitrospinota bacterium]
MYAVVKTGGKQYKVSLGETVRFEKVKGIKGDRVSFDNVLMVNDKEANIGKPEIKGMPVIGEIVEQGNSKKIRIVKKKRRKNYRKTQGHRQPFTTVKIVSIGGTPAVSGAATYATSGTITGATSGTVTKTTRKKTTKTTKTTKTAKIKGSK